MLKKAMKYGSLGMAKVQALRLKSSDGTQVSRELIQIQALPRYLPGNKIQFQDGDGSVEWHDAQVVSGPDGFGKYILSGNNHSSWKITEDVNPERIRVRVDRRLVHDGCDGSPAPAPPTAAANGDARTATGVKNKALFYGTSHHTLDGPRMAPGPTATLHKSPEGISANASTIPKRVHKRVSFAPLASAARGAGVQTVASRRPLTLSRLDRLDRNHHNCKMSDFMDTLNEAV